MKIAFKVFTTVLLFALFINKAVAQNTFPANGSAGIGTIIPSGSAALEIKSTTQGLLISRMTINQRNLISAPVTGLMIYQTNSTPGFYYYDGTKWVAVIQKIKAWSLTGNAGTDSSLNFIGTIDARPLTFKINNHKAGHLDYAPPANTSFGYQSLNLITSAANNAAFGFQTLYANTTGYSNTAIGYEALLQNNTGYENVAIGNLSQAGVAGSSGGYDNVSVGNLAMNGITTGNSNTGIGNGALGGITSGNLNIGIGAGANDGIRKGNENVSIGFWAGRTNDSANNNVSIGSKAAYYNRRNNITAVGYQALYYNSYGSTSLTEAIGNTAVGDHALYYNTSGNDNTANGAYSLYLNTSGNYNTATGYYALFSNTSGYQNTAQGLDALSSNTSGANNSAVGYDALYNNSTAGTNVAVGSYSLFTNTTIGGLTAIGYSALFANTTGTQNTATGFNTLFKNTTGSSNTATGYEALNSNTTGYSNTADGYLALNSNTIGYYNTASGIVALFSNTSGIGNTAIGYAALNDNSSGYYNTGTGQGALYNNTTGQGNTAFGYGADVAAGNFTNAMSLGFFTSVNASNKVEVGNTSITSIGGNVGWTSFSDGRYKQNIKQNVPGLEFINKLTPITYTLNATAIESKLHANESNMKTQDGKPLPSPVNDPVLQQAMLEKSKIIYTGFVAQDVEKAAQSLNYNFSGVDKPKTDDGLYGLRYADFVVPLVKAVQELSSQNESRQQQIDSLNNKLNALENKINQIENAMSQCCSSFSSAMQSSISNQPMQNKEVPNLEQNVPNPFDNSCYIGYYIPSGFQNAQLIITDIAGHVLRSYSITQSGYGKQIIYGSELTGNVYQYSLLIDNKLINTKKMIRAK